MQHRLNRRRFLAVSTCSAAVLALGAAETAPAPKPTETRLETDFECGGGKRPRQLAPGHWQIEASGDPSGYNKYFCVRVTPGSAAAAAKLRLDVYPDSELGQRGRRYFESHFPSYIWFRADGWPRRTARASSSLMQGTWGAGESWVPLQNPRKDAVTFHGTFVELNLELTAGKTIYVASNPAYRYSDLTAWCESLKTAYPQRAAVSSLAKSVEGRTIPLIRLRGSRPKLVKILVLAGQHPGEHGGVWASKGIVEYLLSSIGEARELAEKLDLAVVPMLNVDGNVHGLSGANMEGMDLCEEWTGTTRQTQPKSTESRALWRWLCAEFPPDASLNLHSGLGWKGLADPPYDGALLFSRAVDRLYRDPARMAAFRAMRDRLSFQTPGAVDTGNGGMVLGENFLDYQLAVHFQTLSVLYHVNAGTVGPLEQYRRGPQVFSAMAKALVGDAPLR